jgi:hypothetical protein
MLNLIIYILKIVHYSLSVILIFNSSLRIIKDTDLRYKVGWQFRAYYINATLGRNTGPSVCNSNKGYKHLAS